MPESKGDALVLSLTIGDALPSRTRAGDAALLKLLIQDVESPTKDVTAAPNTTTVYPVGIASAEAFGTPTRTGPTTTVVFPQGIGSSEAFGSATRVRRVVARAGA